MTLPINSKLIFIFISIQFSFLSVYSTETRIDTTLNVSQHTIIRIAPMSAYVTSDDKLFDSVVYIPLETIKDSEFSRITQLEVSEEHFIIFDSNIQSILFFNKDGSFYKKITPNSKDLELTYKYVTSFTIDETNNLLWMDDLHSPYIFTFDIKGNFIKTIQKTSITGNFNIHNGLVFSYHAYESNPSSTKNQSLDANLTVVDQQTKQIINSYLYFDPSKIDNTDLYSPRNFYRSNSDLYFVRSYDYSIYSFDNRGTLQKIYTVILPLNHTLPSDFLTNDKFYGKRMSFTNANPDIVYTFKNVYQVKNWLTFQLSGSEHESSLLYNVVSGELYDLKLLDSKKLPTDTYNVYSDILGVADNALISAIYFNTLQRYYHESTKEKQSETPSSLTDIANRKFHNPTLVMSYL